MPQYECAVVLVPTLTDEQVQEQIEQMKTWLTGLGAQVSDVDVWGRKRLAFPLGKHQEGFYVIYYFTLDQGQARLVEFDKRANTTETILRHMVIRLPALKEPPRLPKEEEEGEGGEGGGPGEQKGEPAPVAAESPKEAVPEVPPVPEPAASLPAPESTAAAPPAAPPASE